MFQIISLTKRNIKIFLRDKTAVFFSLLSVIIMLMLYFLFIRNLFSSELPPDVFSKNMTEYLVTGQMMGGILVINTVSLSLGVLGNIVNDKYFKKLESFLVTPISRKKITLSYYISTALITYILTMMMWIFTIIYILIVTKTTYSLATIIIVSLVLLLYTIISSSFMFLLVSFLSSVSAFGSISGVLGTLIGFLAGIYMPLTILPNGVKYVSSLLPFTHMSIWLKQLILKDQLKELSNSFPAESLDSLKEAFGINNIGVLGFDVPMYIIMIVISVLSLGVFYLSVKRVSKKNN